jgi:hypothetical protein
LTATVFRFITASNIAEDIMELRSIACWCLIVLFPASLWPQSGGSFVEEPAQEKKLHAGEQSSRVKTQIEKHGTGEQAKLKVALRDKRELKGYISRIDADSFQLTDEKSGQATMISYSEVERVHKPGMPVVTKVVITAVTVEVLLGVMAATLPKD